MKGVDMSRIIALVGICSAEVKQVSLGSKVTLTQSGIAQTEIIASTLNLLKVGRIYTSSATCAMQTSAHIGLAMRPYSPSLHINGLLREVDLDLASNLPASGSSTQEFFDQYGHLFAEDMVKFVPARAKRFMHTLRDYLELPGCVEVYGVAFVSHPWFIWGLETLLNNCQPSIENIAPGAMREWLVDIERW